MKKEGLVFGPTFYKGHCYLFWLTLFILRMRFYLAGSGSLSEAIYRGVYFSYSSFPARPDAELELFLLRKWLSREFRLLQAISFEEMRFSPKE